MSVDDVCVGRATRVVSVPSTGTLEIDLGLEPPIATVAFDVRSKNAEPLEANVLRGGRYVGDSQSAIEVPTCMADDKLLREVDFEITAPGYVGEELRLVLAPGETRQIEVVLEPWVARDVDDERSARVARAFEEEEQKCEDGDGNACFKLGRAYADGVSTRPDGLRAAAYHEKACRNGVLAGCYMSARALLRMPAGVDARSRALAMYLESCREGFGLSCNNLAWSFQAGLGTEVDYVKAAQFYSMSCTMKNRTGCSGVAGLKYRGVYPFEERDVAGAFEDYVAACEMVTSEPGLNWGCYFAAEIIAQHEDALSNGVDASRTDKLLRKACRGGISVACDDLR